MCRTVSHMKSTTGIRLTPAIKKSLNKAAQKTGLRKADIIRAAVAYFLEVNEKPDQIIAGVIHQRTKEAGIPAMQEASA